MTPLVIKFQCFGLFFQNHATSRRGCAGWKAEPGSCVILTIEPRKDGKRPDVRIAWVSEAERKKIRKAMIEVNIERGSAKKAAALDRSSVS